MTKPRPYVIAADPGPEGRREHKKARTRDDLVDAAVRLFNERGFDASIVEDIAAAANVSPRTFFRYFASKEEVLFPRRSEELAALKAELQARPAQESPLEALRATVVAYLGTFQTERGFHLLRARLIGESAPLQAYSLHLLQEWTDALARVLSKRMKVNPTSDVRPLLLAGCAIMAMRAALAPWIQSGGTTDLEVFALQVFDQMKRGFSD